MQKRELLLLQDRMIDISTEIGGSELFSSENATTEHESTLLHAINISDNLSDYIDRITKAESCEQRKLIMDLEDKLHEMQSVILKAMNLINDIDNPPGFQIQIEIANKQFYKLQKLISSEKQRDSGPAI